MTTKLTDLILGLTGVILDYAGTTAPSGFLMCYGQAVSRTTYSQLYDVIGTTYGAGDGSTTFNLPDLRGRVSAGLDNMGGTAAARLSVVGTGTTTNSSAIVTSIPTTSALSVGMLVFAATVPYGTTILSIDSGTQITLSTGVGVTTGTASAMRFGVIDGQAIGAAGGSQSHKLVSSQIPSHTHGVYGWVSDGTGGTSFTAPVSGSTYLANNVTQATGGGQSHPIAQPTIIVNKIIKT